MIGSLISLARQKAPAARLTKWLNLTSAILVCLPLAQLGRAAYGNLRRPAQDTHSSPAYVGVEGGGSAFSAPQTPPDIYVIILDTYTRADVLESRLGYDNSAFLRELEQLGFFVASCGHSNYTSTVFSLAALLNMGYVEDFGKELIRSGGRGYDFAAYVKHSAVRSILTELGYRTVALETGFDPTEWEDADEYLTPERSLRARLLGGLNSFETLLLRTTPFSALEALPSLPYSVRVTLWDHAYVEHRERIFYALDVLEDLGASPGPKLVFVHILAPHNPFVFGPSGEFVERTTPFTLNDDRDARLWPDYVKGYVGEVVYLNQRLVEILGRIIEESSMPPIIILQGDHGIPRMREEAERVAILNAYYLGGRRSEALYESISPVNTFRIILDEHFGGNLGLIQDIAYVQEGDSLTFRAIDSASGACAAGNGQ